MEKDKFSQLLYYYPHNLTFYGASDIWTWYSYGHEIDGSIWKNKYGGGKIAKDASIGIHNSTWSGIITIEDIGLEYVPILVPFDKIIDYEIEIDGGKMWLCELLADFDNSLSRENFNANVERTKNIAQTGQYSFNVMQLFFKYHVDVFGLIDLGLAMDYFKFKN